MFQGIVFVVLAAFVAFGATLFMASNTMSARSGAAVIAPAQGPAVAAQATPSETPKATTSRGAKRSSRGK